MREIRPSGSEGGAGVNPLSLPLSGSVAADVSRRTLDWFGNGCGRAAVRRFGAD